jgi:hypothetical protein
MPPAFPTGPQSSRYQPTVEPPPLAAAAPQPPQSSVRLYAPEPAPEASSARDTRNDPPLASVPSPLPTAPPAVAETKSPPLLPVGIPQFASVTERVATGQRPLLDDGLDWLQANGYRTVLHLKKPGTEDDADRKQVEKRGMKYLSLELSAQTLSKKVVDDFNRIVADAALQPLFVYDRDSSLAGGLWYLHFRTAGGASDDVARVRAGALGLREDRDDAHREMWLAIQRFMSEQGR